MATAQPRVVVLGARVDQVQDEVLGEEVFFSSLFFGGGGGLRL